MSPLATLLLAVGTADLLRGSQPGPPRVVRGVLAGIGTVVLVLGLGHLTDAGDVGLLGLVTVAVCLWVALSERARRSDRGHLLPVGVLGLGAALTMVLSGFAGPVSGPLAAWMSWVRVPDLARLTPDRVLLVAGLVLVQLATANLLVRLVLSHVGAIRPAGQSQPSDRLKGGRLLGPMERLVIVGLGLAGFFTAAGLVVAAKGLIRFPELQSQGADGSDLGIHELTEYFLVGSSVSWLVALGSLAVWRLA